MPEIFALREWNKFTVSYCKCLQTLLPFITFWLATCYFAKHMISVHFLMSSRKWLWAWSHTVEGKMFLFSIILQFLSYLECTSYKHLLITVLTFFFLVLPILTWSSTQISHSIPSIYVSIQYKLAVLLQSAYMYLSFLLPWAAPPCRMYFYTLLCL